MERFKKILCYVGGDIDPQPALQRAIEIARTNEATLTLIDILPENQEGPWLIVPGQSRLDELLAHQKQRELATLAETTSPGLHINTTLRTGTPFVELIREVLRGSYDLVIKTAEEAGRGLGGLFGSTALHLMRKCPCPVWVTKSADSQKIGRVLAAIDPGSPQLASARDALNIKILQLAGALAKRSGGSLEVLHVMHLPGVSTVDHSEKERRSMHARIEALVTTSGASSVNPKLRLTRGRPCDVLTASAEDVEITVMGTLSHSGVAGVLIGNTAERVLQRITSSVLTIKPEGFVTPVWLEEDAQRSLRRLSA